MKGLTAEKPKCLLELGGKTLLHWQLAAMRQAGISKIIVVKGYRGDLLQGDFDSVENPRWAETNMVQTLLCALPVLGNADALVSYADIVYKPAHISKLLSAQDDIALTYDTLWRSLWSLRNENPLDDAETFREEGGRLVEIGAKPKALEDVQGQYMGLLRLSQAGQKLIGEYVSVLPQEQADKLDMTSLLNGLLAAGVCIGAVPVDGGWCECDTENDIKIYKKRLAPPAWTHDWRW